MTQLFDRYIFADYSGAGTHDTPQKGIVVATAEGQKTPEVLHLWKEKKFSRDTLREYILQECQNASAKCQRVIFGFDHAYSWPEYLWQAAGLGDLAWPEAVKCLNQGDGKLPPLDLPRTYCQAFNKYAGLEIFWCPLKGLADKFGIPQKKPEGLDDNERYRLTEKRLLKTGFNPKPADAVGGQGQGVVGGQTICGLHHIALLLACDQIRWWPFHGLDIMDEAYTGKHVGVEIYPAILVPGIVKKTDEADAYCSCWAVQTADHLGGLKECMNLDRFSDPDKEKVLKEGWILGI